MIPKIVMDMSPDNIRLGREFPADQPIRWGVWGPGNISHKFAEALEVVHDGYVLAIGSRHLEHAEAWAARHGTERAYGSIEALAADQDIDIVYVASPMSAHYEDCKVLLEAGHSILCEKTVTLNLGQLMELLQLAQDNRCFFMEAMWSRFLPAANEGVRVVEEGIIGDVKVLRASFNIGTPFDPNSRLFDPELGGGTLLDLGVYPIAVTLSFLGGDVKNLQAEAYIGPTGVDHDFNALLAYDHAYAALSAGVDQPEPLVCNIVGTKGRLELVDPFNGVEEVKAFDMYGNQIHYYHWGHEKNGFEYQIRASQEMLREGRLWHPDWSWQHSIHSMALMDSCRRQWGMLYPDEDEAMLGDYASSPSL